MLMSGIVIASIIWHLANLGLAHQTDEGTAAHLFQILMPVQVPIIGFFAAKWLPVDSRWAVKVLIAATRTRGRHRRHGVLYRSSIIRGVYTVANARSRPRISQLLPRREGARG